MAALAYARTRFQTLEVRQRVGLARQVVALLSDSDPTTDRVAFDRGELDGVLEDAEELARLTLLHAGEKSLSGNPPKGPPKPSAVEALLLEVRAAVSEAQGKFSGPDQTMKAVLFAFNLVVGLVGTCKRMAGDPPCARDGDCPEHGRDRPGQCVTMETSP